MPMPMPMPMPSNGVDERTFVKRLKVLYSHWREHKDELWGSADFIAIATPPLNIDSKIGYLKSSTFNRWLLGYEFLETVTVFGNKQIHFLCTQKKNATLLETLKRLVKESINVDVFIHRKRKGNNGITKMDYVIHSMRMSRSDVHDAPPIVGYIANESPQGSFLKKWADKLKNCYLKLSDVTDGLSDLLVNDDPDELTRQINEEIARRFRLASRDSSADDYGANLNMSDEYILEPIRLSYSYIHPPFDGEAGKIAGELVAHANGFRYSNSRRNEQVDIMYANIKHAIFQPEEMLIFVGLIHFHLHNHIEVGGKKTKDVQFSLEMMRIVDTIGGISKWNFPKKEIKKRMEYDDLNFDKTDLKYFVSRVDILWLQPQYKKLNLKFEHLIHEYGFVATIAPNKDSAFIVPTSRCLVELMLPPFDVIPLSEIEIVNLERVGISGQSDFDMTIVFKDFKRDVMHIDFISIGFYGMILEWLDTSGVKYFETRVNVNWRAVIKTFTDDPQAFIDVGGWDFLNREKEIFIDDGGGFSCMDDGQFNIVYGWWWPGQYQRITPGLYNKDSESDNETTESDTSDDDSESDDTGCTAPKQKKRLRKAAFIKMRIGRCFSAPKRKRIIKEAAGPGSSASKRSELMGFVDGEILLHHIIE